MKAEFIDQIDLITEFTDDKLKSVTNIIDKFISDSNNKNHNENNTKGSIFFGHKSVLTIIQIMLVHKI